MSIGKIRIQALAGGHQIFSFLVDPRMELVLHGCTAPAGFEPDLLVYPFAKRAFLEPGDIDPGLWSRVREGRSRLVLDASLDLRLHSEEATSALHRTLAELQVPLGHVAYLTENRLFPWQYRKWRKRQGLKQELSIHYVDYCTRAFTRRYQGAEGARVLAEREKSFDSRSAHRSKAFVCLNRSLRLHKIAVLARLLHDGLWERGHVTAGAYAQANHRIKFAKRLAQVGLEPLVPLVDTHINEIDAKLAPERPWSPTDGLDGLAAEHADSYFSLVTETEMTTEPYRITEKPLKALANFHPLLLMGNVGSLQILKDYGFETFSGYVDESYDTVRDPMERFEKVYAEFVRLCSLSKLELHERERALAEVLRHNARTILVDMPRMFAARADPDLLDALLLPVAQPWSMPVRLFR